MIIADEDLLEKRLSIDFSGGLFLFILRIQSGKRVTRSSENMIDSDDKCWQVLTSDEGSLSIGKKVLNS